MIARTNYTYNIFQASKCTGKQYKPFVPMKEGQQATKDASSVTLRTLSSTRKRMFEYSSTALPSCFLVLSSRGRRCGRAGSASGTGCAPGCRWQFGAGCRAAGAPCPAGPCQTTPEVSRLQSVHRQGDVHLLLWRQKHSSKMLFEDPPGFAAGQQLAPAILERPPPEEGLREPCAHLWSTCKAGSTTQRLTCSQHRPMRLSSIFGRHIRRSCEALNYWL